MIGYPNSLTPRVIRGKPFHSDERGAAVRALIGTRSTKVDEVLEASWDIVEEAVIMGLRLRDGVAVADLRNLGWVPPFERLEELRDLGLLEDFSDRVQTTRAGRPLLNSIISKLLT